jgi:hypothetical protein
MSESLVNYKIGHEKKLLFLGAERVLGVQSCQVSQNLASSPLNYAGIGVDTVKYVPRGEQNNSFSINSYLINKDYFLGAVTGNNLYNLYLTTDKNDFTKHYSLLSGYFTSFETNYSVGGVAEITVNGLSVGDAGKVPTGSMNSAQISDLNFISTGNFDVTGVLIPDIGSIQLNIDTFNTNRLLSYSIRVESNKIPFYTMGARTPKRVDLIYPINVTCNFTFEPGDYQEQRLRNFPVSGVVKNLSVVVGDYKTNATICNYSFNNLNLTAENQEISVNGNTTINQTYQTQILG